MPYLLPFFLIAIGSAFEHEQAQYAENFPGEGPAMRAALRISPYASWATRVALIIHIGLHFSWVAAIGMFIGAMLVAGIFAGLLSAIAARWAGEKGKFYLSSAAFIVWPACFLAAYVTLPRGL